MSARDDIKNFYDQLQTLPKLLGNLALDIAEAQRLLDQNYIESLAAFTKIIAGLGKDKEAYLSLFKAIAPSRYQFTETSIEVRADLQTASSSELGIGAKVGITTAVFAVNVNFSYVKRSASDYQAAAVIRSVLHAIPADPGVLEKLLSQIGPPPSATLLDPRYKALQEALGELKPLPVTPTPNPSSPPLSPQ